MRTVFGWNLILLLAAAGCAMNSKHEDRWFTELQRESARASEERARVALLEARLARMEGDLALTTREQTSSATERRVLEKLDQVLAVNQELLLRDLSHPVREARASELAPASACEADDEDPRDQLRRLVERIHGRASGFRGGLSVDQSAALRLLLRSERTLDPKNPWRETYDDSL